MNSKNVYSKITLLFLCVILLLFSTDKVWSDGYHNSTKKFTSPQKMNKTDWSDPAEIKRTWDAALVRIPNGPNGILKTTMQKLSKMKVPRRKKFPTIIYLHGCSGVWKGTFARIDFLANNGFAVIAPLSFARKKYPQSCDTNTHKGGMYRPTIIMRQNDAGYAISQAKKLSWVDSNNVFLMGLSQGGITTATFQSEDATTAVNARVVEGWTCHAGWEEYRGINAPKDEPVLTLVGEKDPWFQRPNSKGDCGEYLNKTNGSRSIVIRKGRLRNRHELLEDKKVQQEVLKFLRKHIKK